MTINELITKAHGAAKAKGFWDKERNKGELLMLIVSECGEALEAHRKGRRADISSFQARESMGWSSGPAYVRQFKEAFELYIKDSFEDELSDIVIRMADLCGSLEHGDVAQMFKIIHTSTVDKERLFSGTENTASWSVMDLARIPAPENVGEAILGVVERVVHAASQWSPYPLHNISIAMARTASIAKANGIDLDRHIELKMQYNETRERLHGKAY